MQNGNIPPQGYNRPDPQEQWRQQHQQHQHQPKKKVGWLKIAGISVLSLFALSGLVQCVGSGSSPSSSTPYPQATSPQTTMAVPTTTPGSTTTSQTTSTPRVTKPQKYGNVEALQDVWEDMEDEQSKKTIVDSWEAAKEAGYDDDFLEGFVGKLSDPVEELTGQPLTKAEAREFLDWAAQQ